MSATRILSPTEKRELDKQFYRKGRDIYEAGTGRYIGPTEWEKEWTGRAKEVSSPTQPTRELTPLPMQAGEREALINRYLQTMPQMTQKQATARVDELFAGRPPVPTGQVAPRELTFAPTGERLSTALPGQVSMASVQPVDLQQSWNKAMTELLKQYQTTGGDEDLQKQRAALVQARFGARTDITPEQLRVLTPAQQASLRGEDIRGLETQLGGVTATMKARETQRREALDVFDRIQKMAKEELPDIMIETIDKGEDVIIIGIDKKTGREVYRQTIKGAGGGTQRETQVVTARGRTLLIDKNTGEVIKDLGGAYKTTGAISTEREP